MRFNINILLFIILSVIVTSCTNPTNTDSPPEKYHLTNTFPNHLSEDNLSGPISAVVYSTCKETGDSCCLTEKVTYNSSGNRIKDVFYNCPDPQVITAGEWYWYDYFYDTLGRITNVIKMQEKTTKVYEWIDVYDTTDLAARRYYVDHWTTGDSTIQMLSYDSLNRWTGYEEHRIDDWGIDETVFSTLTIQFNEAEKSITSEWKTRNTTTRIQKVIYSEKGLMLEIIEKNAENTVTEHDSYEYTEFDDEGNWISRILTDKDGKKTMERRRIEYY